MIKFGTWKCLFLYFHRQIFSVFAYRPAKSLYFIQFLGAYVVSALWMVICFFSHIFSFYFRFMCIITSCKFAWLIHDWLPQQQMQQKDVMSQQVVHTTTWWPSFAQNRRCWQNITLKTKNKCHIYYHHLYVYLLAHDLSCTQQRWNNEKQLYQYLNEDRGGTSYQRVGWTGEWMDWKMAVWGLSLRKILRTTPSRMLENSHLQDRIKFVFIIILTW